MNCEKMDELMADCLGGEANPADRARMEAHLIACDRCRTEFESMRGVLEQLGSLRNVDPADSEWATGQRLRAVDRPRLPSRSTTRWMRYAAGIALAFIAGYGTSSLQTSTGWTGGSGTAGGFGVDRVPVATRWPEQIVTDASGSSFGSAWLRARVNAPGRSDFAACLLAMSEPRR